MAGDDALPQNRFRLVGCLGARRPSPFRTCRRCYTAHTPTARSVDAAPTELSQAFIGHELIKILLLRSTF